MNRDVLNIILLNMNKKFIYRGAEAVLYKVGSMLVKERISKGYRRPEIDLVKRKYPTRREDKLLKKCKAVGVNVPEVLMFNEDECKIGIEFIKGDLLKSSLDSYDDNKRKKVCVEIGKQVALMHDRNIIHGDLTTSNMIWNDGKVYFVDFGLGYISEKIEDKAVDIHLVRQAFESKHFMFYEECFKNFLLGYKKSEKYKETMERLGKVELRGRYKRKSN